MHVELIAPNDRTRDDLRELLLLADEQWDCVERYLEQSNMYALIDKGEPIAECCLTDEGAGTGELQNLAVRPDRQREGWGAYLVSYALRRCRGRFERLRVGTGDSPLTVPFYERCGFVPVARIPNDILNRYDHPIFEAGIQVTDTVVFEQPVPSSRPATRVFTSDLHLGSPAIARWRGFSTVEEHDTQVLRSMDECLLQDDELWLLGDLCKPRVEDVRNLRAALPCNRVHVIIGNHDSKAKFLTVGGFASVEYYGHVGKVRRDGYKFVLSHYPMLDWDRAYHGSYMLHGHIHSLPSDSISHSKSHSIPADRNHGGMGMSGYNDAMRTTGTRRYDVGLDANRMMPVTAEQIVAALPSNEEWSVLHGLPVD